jgi:ribosome-associated translation inhibitor RaiA
MEMFSVGLPCAGRYGCAVKITSCLHREIFMPLIEHILEELPADERHLCFIFEQNDEGYSAEATLALSSGNVRARSKCPQTDHKAAIDDVIAKLARELRRRQDGMTVRPFAQVTYAPMVQLTPTDLIEPFLLTL